MDAFTFKIFSKAISYSKTAGTSPYDNVVILLGQASNPVQNNRTRCELSRGGSGDGSQCQLKYDHDDVCTVNEENSYFRNKPTKRQWL
jgi:hypothetical protein